MSAPMRLTPRGRFLAGWAVMLAGCTAFWAIFLLAAAWGLGWRP